MRAFPITDFEAPANMSQSDAKLVWGWGVGVKGVFHVDDNLAIAALNSESDFARIDHTGDAVFDGVFHQRLQEHGRDGAVLARVFNFFDDFQARAEAHLLHRKITVRQCELFPQRYALAPGQGEAAAKKLAQPD